VSLLWSVRLEKEKVKAGRKRKKPEKGQERAGNITGRQGKGTGDARAPRGHYVEEGAETGE